MRAAVPTDAPPETALEAAFPPAFAFVVATQFVFGLAVSTYAILPSVVIRHLHGTSDDVGLASAGGMIAVVLANIVATFLIRSIARDVTA